MKFQKILLVSLSITLSTLTYAAKPFVVEAKCPVQIIDASIAPKNVPEYIYGTAKNNNKALACSSAKKAAIDKFPQGTKPKHCRCIYK